MGTIADSAPPRSKLAILISGTGTNMAALLYASRLPDAGYEVVLVASNRPDAEGLKLAATEGVATFSQPHKGMSRTDHDAVMEAAIVEAGADIIALAGYMRILSDGFVERWEGRMLNIHPSLLPKYRGLDTHQRAIDAGDSHAGVSVHLVSPELDAGEVLGQIPLPIQRTDTAETLATRIRFAEHQLYPRVLNEYVGRFANADWLLQQVQQRALDLPEAEARDSHGAPAWKLAGKSGKFFAHFSDTHHGSPHIGVLVKAGGMDELESLCDDRPDIYFKPAYYGASGWIGIILNRQDVDWDHVSHWLERSWRAVAPKRLAERRAVGPRAAADEF